MDEGWVAQLLEVIMVVGVFVPYVPGRHGRVMYEVPSVQQPVSDDVLATLSQYKPFTVLLEAMFPYTALPSKT